jgi:hypothetical protein
VATAIGIAEFTSAAAEIQQVLEDYGNTIWITPITLSDDTDINGEFVKTPGTPFDVSSVTYDTVSLRKDFGLSVVLNDGESLMLVKPSATINANDIVKIDDIEYIAKDASLLKAADVEIAQLLTVGVNNKA